MTSLVLLIQCSLADHFFSERYLIKLARFLCGKGKEKDLEKLLLIAFFWTIWLEQNQRTFKNKEQIDQKIKLSFLCNLSA